MKHTFTRKMLTKPYASLKTEQNSKRAKVLLVCARSARKCFCFAREARERVFHKYLYDNDILHKVSLTDRHNHNQMLNL